jgi:hypothetical protein
MADVDKVKISVKYRIDKYNDAGDLYEVVTVDDSGRRVMYSSGSPEWPDIMKGILNGIAMEAVEAYLKNKYSVVSTEERES